MLKAKLSNRLYTDNPFSHSLFSCGIKSFDTLLCFYRFAHDLGTISISAFIAKKYTNAKWQRLSSLI